MSKINKTFIAIFLVLFIASCAVNPSVGLSENEEVELMRLMEKLEDASDGINETEVEISSTIKIKVRLDLLSPEEQNEYKRMLRRIVGEAHKGNPESQFLIGLMYREGRFGFPLDYEKSATWFLKSAELGDRDAQKYVGDLYVSGKGFLLNYRRAFEWYEKAAAQGNKEVFCDLGYHYYRGVGVRKDYQKALEYFEKGIKEDEILCITSLGRMYSNGQGVPVDKEKAIELWEKSTLLGSHLAPYEIFKVYRDDRIGSEPEVLALKWLSIGLLRTKHRDYEEARDEWVKALSKEQISRADLLMREWIKKNPNKGFQLRN